MTVWDTLERIRADPPLIQCITNLVAANFAANAVIAVGGSPVMAADPDESPNFTAIANALTVNIGTCNAATITAIEKCTKVSVARGLPWVLDPVGVAASKPRQELCTRLLKEHSVGVLRGNASEIMALATSSGALSQEEAAKLGAAGGRGLDSTLGAEIALPGAQALAKKFNCVVAMSGACDFVVSPKNQVARIVNGHPMMAQVTATGCSLTAILGCFMAQVDADHDVFTMTTHALSYYAVAGELAAREAEGGKTGTMHTKLLDYLGAMTEEEYFSVARPPLDLSLYLVTDPKLNLGRENPEIVESAIKGGTTVVQLREKNCDSGEFYERAKALKKVCDQYDVPLIINDRLDIALAVDAAGLHIGQSDLPPQVARKLLGPTKLLGLSVSTAEEFEKLKEIDDPKLIDYIGVGPVYATATKADAKAALGLEKLQEQIKGITHLIVAIGGINLSNAHQVLAVPGVHGVAVVTALTMAEDPAQAARELSHKSIN